MPGQPRRRRAGLLAAGLHAELWFHGPAPITDLLERRGYGPTHWPYLSRTDKAIARMAVARLMARGDVRLAVTGELYIAGRRRRAA